MLEEIILNKRKQIERNRELYPIKLLETSVFFDSEVVSLINYLLKENKFGIIAEFKRASPSKKMINQYANVAQTTIGYMQAGASALSILTDEKYFSGKNEDLITARKVNYCPILRKDFIVSAYQVIETKSIGADAILLIAACLEKKELESLYKLSVSLGLEVLIEIHDKSELKKLPNGEFVLGVNNRSLKTMQVDIQTSINLAKDLAEDNLLISESGLKTKDEILLLKDHGFKGFLIGEQFMKTPDPANTLSKLVSELNVAALC